jgi:hypothetical protein
MNEKGDIVKELWQQLRTGKLISSTYFLSKKERIRMTVKRYDFGTGKKIPKREQEYILSYGKPNFAEREFIKKNPDKKWMWKEMK